MNQIIDVLMILLMPILFITLIILLAKLIWDSGSSKKSNKSICDLKEQLNRIEEKIDKIEQDKE